MKKTSKSYITLLICVAIAGCTAILLVILWTARVPLEKQPDITSVQPLQQLPEEILASDVSILTGLPLKDEVTKGQRICAVFINNVSSGRPSRGLSEAQIVMEAAVEGGITRFMALYDDYRIIPEVGSLRSGRRQFLEIILPFQPILVSNGSNVHMNDLIAEYDYEEWHISYPNENVFWGDKERIKKGYTAEHTKYTDGESITKEIIRSKMDDERDYQSSFFMFVPYDEEPHLPAGGAGESIEVLFYGLPSQVLNEGGESVQRSSAYRSYFEYDINSERYGMSQYNSSKGVIKKTIDENNGEQVFFDNVLVLFAPVHPIGGDDLIGQVIPVVEYGNGVGYYFSKGKYEEIYWKKGGPQEGLRLFYNDKTETPYLLNPGTTYLAVTDVEMADTFAFGEADNAMALGERMEVSIVCR